MGHDHSHDRPSRRDFLGSTAAAGATLPLSALAFAALPELASGMGRAAQAWLGSLGRDQQARARLAWADPRATPGTTCRAAAPASPCATMSSAQAAAAWDLHRHFAQRARARTGARPTHARAHAGRADRNTRAFAIPATMPSCCSVIRGERALVLALRGTPSVAHDGGGARHGLAVTPVFFGANPAKVPARPCPGGLSPARRRGGSGLLPRPFARGRRARAGGDRRPLARRYRRGPGPRAVAASASKASRSSASAKASATASCRILELYAGTMREEIATPALARLRQAGLETLHFAWAGSPERGRPHYFRVHGPTVLVEYDNTQDGANHVHSVWIDPDSRVRPRSPQGPLPGGALRQSAG